MKYEIQIALRYLKSKTSLVFISVNSLISLLGIMLGVTALIVIMSVMNGFRNDVEKKYLGINAHIVVQSQDRTGIKDYEDCIERIVNIKEVAGASPFISTQAIVRKNRQICGIELKGIDAKREASVISLNSYVIKGNINSMKANGILLGQELTFRLGVGIGDTVTVIFPMEINTLVNIVPVFEDFRVAGIFKSGMYEYDSTFGFIDYKAGQSILGMGKKITGIQVKLKDGDKSRKICEEIQNMLGDGYWVRTWLDMNRNLFYALELEKKVMFIILFLIIIVAAFNILSTLIMLVLEKRKAVGILRAMGATSKSIMKIFFYMGFIIGVIGTGWGIIMGVFLCWIISKYKLLTLPGDVYYITQIPVLIKWEDILLIVTISLAVSALSTIYPAFKASKLNPVEAIRSE